MSLLLLVVVFVTVVIGVFAFGAAAVTPSSVLGARLRALGERPAIRERIEQALDPLSKAIPLSPTDVSRTRRWLIQAGFRDAIDVNYYFGVRLLAAAIGFVGVVVFSGFSNPFLLAGISGLGFFLPRFILKRMIRDRQNRIRLGLPDALDLTVICVEAGLALDQALMRVGQDLTSATNSISSIWRCVPVNPAPKLSAIWSSAPVLTTSALLLVH
jgi:tight adherence protein C